MSRYCIYITNNLIKCTLLISPLIKNYYETRDPLWNTSSQSFLLNSFLFILLFIKVFSTSVYFPQSYSEHIVCFYLWTKMRKTYVSSTVIQIWKSSVQKCKTKGSTKGTHSGQSKINQTRPWGIRENKKRRRRNTFDFSKITW